MEELGQKNHLKQTFEYRRMHSPFLDCQTLSHRIVAKIHLILFQNWARKIDFGLETW